MLRRVVVLLAVLCTVFAVGTAQAIPKLQIYIEGATYDATTQTWVVTDDEFTLWVIGNLEGPGGQGTIEDVSLTAAYLTGETGSITLTSTTTGGFGGFTDGSTPSAPIETISGGNDGDIPQLGDGSDLPTHGVYGDGTSFYQWSLGDFDTADSPVGDFIDSFPTPIGTSEAQINAYHVVVDGFSQVHFDAFNHIAGSTSGSFFAPFSHDAEGGGDGDVPEPSAMLLLGGGLMGLAGTRFVRKK